MAPAQRTMVSAYSILGLCAYRVEPLDASSSPEPLDASSSPEMSFRDLSYGQRNEEACSFESVRNEIG